MKEQIVDIVLSTIAAQGVRLSSLAEFGASFEGWWKAEIAMALQTHFSGSNRSDFCARVESKPHWAQLCEAKNKNRFDVAVVPVDPTSKEPNYCAMPRVWLYLKERATWWDGGARKALLEAGRSVDADLRKGREVNWTAGDFAAAAQITWYPNALEARELPSPWESMIADLANKYGRWGEPLRICYPRGAGGCNLVACDIFGIHEGTNASVERQNAP